jgi:hypothetical protein
VHDNKPRPVAQRARVARSLSLLGAPPFYALALVLFAVFLITHLPFFWYYPDVGLSQDSNSYLDIVNTIRSGTWPHFIFRTPGYPLFIWLVTTFIDRWLAVVFLQSLLTFASALCLVYSIFRLRRPLALPAALAMCGFLGSAQVMFYDISLLSDSLYTSSLILSISFLLLAFGARAPPHFAVASALMALSILVRPAGLYLVVVYAIVLAYLLWNRCGWRPALAFAAPFPALILAFCAYNGATLGEFVISPFAEANYAGATVLFWERDPRLPARVNDALKGLPDSYRDQGITGEDLDAVRASWDTDALFNIYTKAYNRMIWSAGWGSGTKFGADTYLHNRGYIRDVSMMAIRRHPVLYAKYVWVNMVKYFEGVGYKFDIYSSLAYRTRGKLTGETRAFYSGGDGSLADSPPPASAATGGADSAADQSRTERLLRALQLTWQSLHGRIFQTTFWSWAYFAMLALSIVQLARTRGRSLGPFLLGVIALIPVGASLVVCLVETATDRYSYPTQFVYYLAVALAPLLWAEGMSVGSGKPATAPAPGPRGGARPNAP